jgi:hypothetical protein
MTKIDFEITDPHALAKQYPQFVTFEPKVNRQKVKKALELGIALDGVKVLNAAVAETEKPSESAQPEEMVKPAFLR